MSQTSIPYMQIRGGSSKGLYFLASDLPRDEELRDQVLLEAIGRDARQIDGLGGAEPLTSKIAVVSLSLGDDCDIDYLFVQVVVGEDRVDTIANCGNILAGVGPYAIEAGLVDALDGMTPIRVNMINSGKQCLLQVQTKDGAVKYCGDIGIDGVPHTAAPVVCHYRELAGSACGALLPTGNVVDTVKVSGCNQTIQVTCVDNGMPVVVLRAEDLGITGKEPPELLDSNVDLKRKLEAIRLQLSPMMNLGDGRGATVPKMCMISSPDHGGVVCTRTFIPYKCHAAIGVLGAVSVATACMIPGSVAEGLADLSKDAQTLSIEHPSGYLSVSLEVDFFDNKPFVKTAGVVRTARLLSRGELFIREDFSFGKEAM